VESRKRVFEKFFPNERFKNFSPTFCNSEDDIDMTQVERDDNKLEKALRSKRLHTPKEMMKFILTEGLVNATENETGVHLY